MIHIHVNGFVVEIEQKSWRFDIGTEEATLTVPLSRAEALEIQRRLFKADESGTPKASND